MKSFDKKVKDSQNGNEREFRPQHTATGYGHLRALQALADNSPQSKQLMRTKSFIAKKSENFTPTITPVQLRALVAGKLNVVGEEHGESDARRELEREICAEHVGGGYWQEGDVLGEDLRNCITICCYDDKRTRGDSPALLVDQFAAFMLKICRRYSAFIEAKLEERVSGQQMILVESNIKILKEIVQHSVDFYHSYGNMHDVGPKLKLSYFVCNIRDIVSEVINDTITSASTSEKFRTAVAGLDEELKRRNKNDIAYERSIHMEQSAASLPPQAGVWKVGDAHISDFVEPANEKYVVRTRDEFNEQFGLPTVKAKDDALRRKMKKYNDYKKGKGLRYKETKETKETKPPPSS
ncbi:hypothetical protein GJ699_06295 [Duganella sp. FT80W]|uniref:Uncharacterized protein n=1 Tax=Duganella guangzhouensis TaxID=2666084 RepID=A0A6I2KX60_9BURK|nr:hypothetical protein [Duganella guangzhouensis]MRW89587.1 hypothetical protein [Duganella guangzhouensis]